MREVVAEFFKRVYERVHELVSDNYRLARYDEMREAEELGDRCDPEFYKKRFRVRVRD